MFRIPLLPVTNTVAFTYEIWHKRRADMFIFEDFYLFTKKIKRDSHCSPRTELWWINMFQLTTCREKEKGGKWKDGTHTSGDRKAISESTPVKMNVTTTTLNRAQLIHISVCNKTSHRVAEVKAYLNNTASIWTRATVVSYSQTCGSFL